MFYLLLWGCTGSEERPPVGGDDSATTVGCPAGEVDDGGECVPERCGVGTWGGREADVYVDASAAPGGDGSAEAPFVSVAEAVAVAPERGGRVGLAAGVWREALALGETHDGLSVRGRCPELTVLDGTDAEPDTFLVGLDGARRTEVGLAGLTVVGGAASGVGVMAGSLTLEDVEIERSVTVGLWGDGTNTFIQADRVGIRDTTPERRDTVGRGIQVQGGATLSCQECVIERNVEVGVLAAVADLTLVDTLVSATAAADEDWGVGVELYGGTALLTRVVVDGNLYAGIEMVSGAEVTLESVDVSGTGKTPGGAGGVGVWVSDATVAWTGGSVSGSEVADVYLDDPGAMLSVTGVSVGDPAGTSAQGVLMIGGEAELDEVVIAGATTRGVGMEAGSMTLSGSRVEGTLEGPYGARGVEVSGTGSLRAVATVIEGNSYLGVYASGAEASVRLEACEVRGSLPAADGEGGYGLLSADGAWIEVEDSLIDANVEIAVWARDGGTVALTGGEVRGTVAAGDGVGGVGLYASSGGHLEAVGVVVSENQTLGAYVDAATADLEDIELRATRTDDWGEFGRGLQVQSGAVARLAASTVVDNHQMGVVVVTPGTELEVDDVRILDTVDAAGVGYGVGLQVEGGAWVWGQEVEVDGARSSGVLAFADARLDVEGLTVRNVPEVGGWAGHGLVVLDGAAAEVGSMFVEEVAGIGALASGGSLSLRSPVVQAVHRTTGYTAGFGVVGQEGATVLLDGPELSGIEGPGVVSLGGTVEVSGGTVRDVGFAGGVFVGGTVAVDGVVVEEVVADEQLGGGVGFFLTGDAATHATLVGSRVAAAPLAAVWWGAEGSLTVEDSELEAGPGVELKGNAAMGAAVYARASAPTLQGNVLHDGRVGLFLDGVGATLLGNTWSGLEVPLRQQDCEGVDPPGGGEVVEGAVLCEGFDELVVTPVFGIVFVEPEVVSG